MSDIPYKFKSREEERQWKAHFIRFLRKAIPGLRRYKTRDYEIAQEPRVKLAELNIPRFPLFQRMQDSEIKKD